ncbi:hypothetical protein [Trinickia dinghuensis]|uniref:Uncharacterized protein n=1 Tax=Trinickia dinghuensis TaxID=2291023 RepID=A0A3D8K1J6_9BURK|nr:hypothetical protein [Trinickia dinghuensis]RDU98764.1 hypothetical protein DWV00_10875 [Trinickia dinghuensis]
MENTLQNAGAVDSGRRETNAVELTAAGRLLIAAAIAAAGFGGWRAYQHYGAFEAPMAVMHPTVVRSASVPRARAANAAAGAGTSSTASDAGIGSTASDSAVSKLAQVTDLLQQERAQRSTQAAAWRSVADTSRQQIAALSSQLQAVESKIDALEKAASASRASHEVVADVAASARAVRPALDAAKSTAQVDVASLPVETISAQSLNLTGLGNGVIQIGNQKLAVGQALAPGETIVAVDPVSRSIVTNRRILNVTN